MSLLVKANRQGRDIVRVTPESAGWKHVGFSAHRLAPGESLRVEEAAREACIVVLSGTVTVATGQQTWAKIGGRTSVFDDAAPYADLSTAADRGHRDRARQRRDRRGYRAGRRQVSGAADRAGPDETLGARQAAKHALRVRRAAGDRAGRESARGGGAHALGAFVVLSAAQARPGRHSRGELPGGNLLPSPQPAAGLRVSARVHRRPFDRRVVRGGRLGTS